jgi:hypothetical protein
MKNSKEKNMDHSKGQQVECRKVTLHLEISLPEKLYTELLTMHSQCKEPGWEISFPAFVAEILEAHAASHRLPSVLQKLDALKRKNISHEIHNNDVRRIAHPFDIRKLL